MYEKLSNLYKQFSFTFNAMPTSILHMINSQKQLPNFLNSFFNKPDINISQFQQYFLNVLSF
jgi:hypothetical protein